MYNILLLTLISVTTISGVMAIPAAQKASAAKASQTVTLTTTKTLTVTSCPAGPSTSRQLTSVTNSRPTSSSSASAVPSGVPIYDPVKCVWNVPGAGSFKHKAEYTFFEDRLPSGLRASDYVVKDTQNGAPYNHRFSPDNIYSDGDFLNLKVPGVASPHAGMDVSSAEVVTERNDILYASVRTNAIFDIEPGTCAGIFYYKDDSHEIDIEFLSDPQSRGNTVSPIPLWYSNQAITPGTPATQSIGPPPWDVTAVHEYRIDWTKNFTAFYLDGVLQKKYTDNISRVPGYWIWNNWANGDIEWSVGPPVKDNIMKIQNITMYFNTATDSATC